MESLDFTKDQQQIKRRKRCGECQPCRVTKNCEHCKNCVNRKILKQTCIYRKCLYLQRGFREKNDDDYLTGSGAVSPSENQVLDHHGNGNHGNNQILPPIMPQDHRLFQNGLSNNNMRPVICLPPQTQMTQNGVFSQVQSWPAVVPQHPRFIQQTAPPKYAHPPTTNLIKDRLLNESLPYDNPLIPKNGCLNDSFSSMLDDSSPRADLEEHTPPNNQKTPFAAALVTHDSSSVQLFGCSVLDEVQENRPKGQNCLNYADDLVLSDDLAASRLAGLASVY